MLTTTCVLTVVLQLLPAEALDYALQSQRKVRVSRATAREAVTRLGAADLEDLPKLIEVARAGRAPGLAAALVALVNDEVNDGHARIATVALTRVDRRARERALPRDRAAWAARLQALAESEDDEAADAAVVLLAPVAPPQVLSDQLQSWSSDKRTERRARTLIAQADLFSQPGKAFAALVDLDLPEHLQALLVEALPKLVAKDEGAAEAVLARAEEGLWGSGAVVMRCLGSVQTPEHMGRASALVLDSIVGDLDADPGEVDTRVFAAALRSSADLLIAEVLEELPFLMQHGRSLEVRRAAIWAFARLAYRDAPSIDLLLSLLSDAGVATHAHEALRLKSGVQLSLRVDAWKAWRHAQDLPLEPPETASERLARQRNLSLRMRRRRKAR